MVALGGLVIQLAEAYVLIGGAWIGAGQAKEKCVGAAALGGGDLSGAGERRSGGAISGAGVSDGIDFAGTVVGNEVE